MTVGWLTARSTGPLARIRSPRPVNVTVRRNDMENPKQVHAALVGFTIIGSVGFAALSLYLWQVWPIAVWGLFLVGLVVMFAIITVIYGVTVWPLLLLIGRVFDRPSKTDSSAAVSAEPPAAADRGQHPPGKKPTGSGGRGS